MNDDTLRRQLQQIQGEEPAPEFVDRLRSSLSGESSAGGGSAGNGGPVTMIGLQSPAPETPRRFRPMWPLLAAAVVLGAVLLTVAFPTDDVPVDTATTTEAVQTGEAWLESIVNNDREAFEMLHAAELESNDTLMAYSKDLGLLTPSTVSELYLDGFDAFQVSLTADGDVLRPDGCEGADPGVARCRYTASLIGTEDYAYTAVAELTVVDGRIVAVDFAEVSTKPADLRSEIQDFMDEEATDEDRACLVLGFNTVGCGRHDSDFMARYIAYYESRQG